jgi:hypothetical protein
MAVGVGESAQMFERHAVSGDRVWVNGLSLQVCITFVSVHVLTS